MQEPECRRGERAARIARPARFARPRRRVLQLWAALWLAPALGCGPDKQQQRQIAAEHAFAAAAAKDSELADELGKALVSLAQREAPGWAKDGRLLRGSLIERGKQDFLVVLRYGHCYRFLGVAANERADLDLRLFDALGVERQRDVTEGPTPVLNSVCPDAAGAMRIEARMRHGQGAFAIAVLHDPT